MEGDAILRAMHLARVVGRVVSTVTQDTLSGVTLQWLQPVNARGANAGKPLIAVDRLTVPAGIGELWRRKSSHVRLDGLTIHSPPEHGDFMSAGDTATAAHAPAAVSATAEYVKQIVIDEARHV